MNFLAVDTSSEYLTVVAVKDGKATLSCLPDCSMRHSVALMNEVERVLGEAGLTLNDCDFFSAVVGAGSFTGIRIGISAAKGFCLATGKPSLPVTSFDIMAYNGVKGKIICLVNALHDYYYVCGYEDGVMKIQPQYLSEEEVLAFVKEGYALLSTTALPIEEKTQVLRVDPAKGLLNAVTMLAKSEKFGELAALYVRKSSAELNLGV